MLCRDGPDTLPLEQIGCLSYISISWLTAIMVKAFRTGLSRLDLPRLSVRDQAITNAARLERLWKSECEEAKAKGRSPSLATAVWKFIRTRFFIAAFLLLVSIVMQFFGPVGHSHKIYLEII
jgi:hypothetical protein